MSRPITDMGAYLRQQDENERYEAERLADRLRDHTPAPRPYEPPKVTSAMVALAWTVLNGREDECEEAAKALAELVMGPPDGDHAGPSTTEPQAEPIPTQPDL